MASIRTLKRRIKTAKNIAQITRAMEMVAASKMRKAQETALAGRTYSEELTKILDRLAKRVDADTHPLLNLNTPVKDIAIILISTDKGLCGGLNTNLFLETERFISQKQLDRSNIKVLTVGKKARDYGAKAGFSLAASFVDLGDRPTTQDIRPLAKLIINNYIQHQYRQVWIAYPRFISTLAQTPTVTQLLPLASLDLVTDQNYDASTDYQFEPNPEKILDLLLPYFIENRIYQLILESRASEQSARMVAMKNAHDSAKDLASDLTLTYNRVRQARVTNELLDAIGSRMAIS